MRVMMAHGRAAVMAVLVICAACSRPSGQSSTSDANAGIDSMNARLMRAYHDRDPKAYGTLFTDTAVFEWPAFTTVRGRAGMEGMARGNWASLKDQELRLDVASRRIAVDQATEFGAFQQSYRDSTGPRMTEFGRYVVVLIREPDNNWRMDHFFGFSDSTRPAPARP